MSSPSVVCVSESSPSTMDPHLCLQCMCGDDEWVKWGWLSTWLAWSLSSNWATSLPQACAILLPATRLPTIIEAGPTSVQHNDIHPSHHTCQWSQGQHLYQHKNWHSTERKIRQSLHASFVSKPGPCWDIWWSTWLFLSWLGQVGDTCVRAHEDVAGVQGTFQEALFGLRYMDAAQGSLRKCVSRHQSQTVHPDLVDAVYCLETER